MVEGNILISTSISVLQHSTFVFKPTNFLLFVKLFGNIAMTHFLFNMNFHFCSIQNPLGDIDNITVNNKGLMENEILETLANNMNFT